MKFKDKLDDMGACREAVKWVNGHGFKKSWATCQRGDWMLWYVFHNKKDIGLEDMRLITLAKALTVKLILPLLKDKRSIKAVKIAEAFGRGKATREQLYDAADDAYAAANAAAYADADAADAAAAYAGAAADAYAADAAAAAGAAADAYAADAYAANAVANAVAAANARKDILSKSADICREVFKDIKLK
jgi:hypothetical protein